ncbi:MAG TPA: hypothetical protein VM573_03790 [Actinomycetota bacterium]|jgi:cytochrome c biogenesis protein CcdA|nr:hypothetical protein [Actinomycetota bacterium]
MPGDSMWMVLLGLAPAAAAASVLSPCTFPHLARVLARDARGWWVAVGAAVFGFVASIPVAAIAGALTPTRGLQFVAGVACVVLGLMQAGAVPSPFRRADRIAVPLLRRQAVLRRRSPAAGHLLLGFAYVPAGFG